MGSARGQSASTGSGPTATVGPIRPPFHLWTHPSPPSIPESRPGCRRTGGDL